MARSSVVVLRDLLRAALRDELPDGWFYLPESSRIDLSTSVLFVADADDLEYDQRGIPRAASDGGFLREGLDTSTLMDVVQGAARFASPPPDNLLLEAFIYYHKFDAFLPHPGAQDPKPWSEFVHSQDLKFYDSLGPERAGIPCREPACTRGAVAYSVLCRPHHFENVKGKLSPFRH